MEAVSVNSDIFLDCDLKVDSLTDLYIFTWEGLDTGKKNPPKHWLLYRMLLHMQLFNLNLIRLCFFVPFSSEISVNQCISEQELYLQRC